MPSIHQQILTWSLHEAGLLLGAGGIWVRKIEGSFYGYSFENRALTGTVDAWVVSRWEFNQLHKSSRY